MPKMNEFVTIMDIPFLNQTKKDFINDYLHPRLKSQETCFVVTANPEIVMKTRENTMYKEIVQSANYVVPDGTGILVAAKYKRQPLEERIAGFELMTDLLELAEQEGLSCYFLGARQEVNEQAIRNVKQQFPELTIAGNHDGFLKMNDKELVGRIRKTSPDIIFVALGLPRQEQWIFKYKEEFSKGLFIGVGGSFDVLAGEVKRAPEAWINLNLEWLYRIIKQPFRLKRIFKVFEFMLRIILGGRNS